MSRAALGLVLAVATTALAVGAPSGPPAEGLAIPLVLLATGFSARLRDAAFRLGRHGIPAVALYAVFYRAPSRGLSCSLRSFSAQSTDVGASPS